MARPPEVIPPYEVKSNLERNLYPIFGKKNSIDASLLSSKEILYQSHADKSLTYTFADSMLGGANYALVQIETYHSTSFQESVDMVNADGSFLNQVLWAGGVSPDTLPGPGTPYKDDGWWTQLTTSTESKTNDKTLHIKWAGSFGHIASHKVGIGIYKEDFIGNIEGVNIVIDMQTRRVRARNTKEAVSFENASQILPLLQPRIFSELKINERENLVFVKFRGLPDPHSHTELAVPLVIQPRIP